MIVPQARKSVSAGSLSTPTPTPRPRTPRGGAFRFGSTLSRSPWLWGSRPGLHDEEHGPLRFPFPLALAADDLVVGPVHGRRGPVLISEPHENTVARGSGLGPVPDQGGDVHEFPTLARGVGGLSLGLFRGARLGAPGDHFGPVVVDLEHADRAG